MEEVACEFGILHIQEICNSFSLRNNITNANPSKDKNGCVCVCVCVCVCM